MNSLGRLSNILPRKLLKAKVLRGIIRDSPGIISEGNGADGTGVSGTYTAPAWVTASCFIPLDWAVGCLVPTVTCFTFPLFFGLSSGRLRKPFLTMTPRKLKATPWLQVNPKQEKRLYLKCMPFLHMLVKLISCHSSPLAIGNTYKLWLWSSLVWNKLQTV